jgi:hypothetical protein
VRKHCQDRGWEVSVVWRMQREDVAAPPIKPGIEQHEESFEVTRADGSIKFVYFDENPSRRAINGRLSKQAAFKRAQELLRG